MPRLLIANWKSYLTEAQSVRLARSLRRSVRSSAVHLGICPAPVALPAVGALLHGGRIALGAQNVATGPSAALHLRGMGCAYVIVGHSSVRGKETDAVVAKKLLAVSAVGMTPILCVGEPLTVRQRGRAAQFVRTQLAKDLKSWRGKQLIIAYEPIWAIQGKDFTAECQPADAFAMATVIKRSLGTRKARLLYGGSVSAKNIARYVDGRHFRGALVGKASTTLAGFTGMVRRLA